ncbi:unnamed protein product [Amoebophrya sp. A120]|nr:unnamed protein product [Amoebophrya sp. A120]|eukprot:GSA120T00016141001.1
MIFITCMILFHGHAFSRNLPERERLGSTMSMTQIVLLRLIANAWSRSRHSHACFLDRVSNANRRGQVRSVRGASREILHTSRKPFFFDLEGANNTQRGSLCDNLLRHFLTFSLVISNMQLGRWYNLLCIQWGFCFAQVALARVFDLLLLGGSSPSRA